MTKVMHKILLYFNEYTGEIGSEYMPYKTRPMHCDSTPYYNLNGEMIGCKINGKIFRGPFTKPLKSYWKLTPDKVEIKYITNNLHLRK